MEQSKGGTWIMQQILLQTIPNQSLTFQFSEQTYDLRLHTCVYSSYQIMAATLFINNVLILSSARLVSGFPIIPTQYQENGNFIITTMNDELPDYNQFQITQYLIYASPAEITTINAGTFVNNSPVD